jgi:hypothetical protein
MKVVSDTLDKVRTAFLGEESYRQPKNEQQTCDWVILPLVRSLGYSEFDIEAQKNSGTGGRADYVLYTRRPGGDPIISECKWILEAKHWGTALADADRLQARTYAFQLQAKVAVLTNGQIWEVLEVTNDNRVKNFVIASGSLKSDSFLEFLQCLAPETIESDAIRTFGNRKRAVEFVQSLFSGPESAGVLWAANEVFQQFGVNLSGDEILTILRRNENRPNIGQAELATEKTKVHSDQIEIFIDKNGVKANAIFNGGRQVTVLRGSSSNRIGSRADRQVYLAQREKLARSGAVSVDGDSVLFLQDYAFGSPSGASDFLLGQSTNGWDHWLDRDGAPLQRYRA